MSATLADLEKLNRPWKLHSGPGGVWVIIVLNAEGDFPVMEDHRCETAAEALEKAARYMRWVAELEQSVAA